MGTAMANAPTEESRALVELRTQASKMGDEFAKMLPSHIPADRFARVVMNAINRTPRLVMCDRKSLWNACMQAAEDGLLPDKREGAIVPFKKGGDDDGATVGKAGDYIATWIPMVHGIRKLVRNSGEIRDLNVQLVYEDENAHGMFAFELGDAPFLKHKRVPFEGDPAKRPVHAGYSLAWAKDGTLFVPEVMFENEIMAVARRSMGFKKGPWSDPLWALEMRKKTVTKRHFKQLPTSRELERALSRDDFLLQYEEERKRQADNISTIRGGARDRLDHFAGEQPEPRREPPVQLRTDVPAAEEPQPDETTEGEGAPQESQAAPQTQEPKAEDSSAAKTADDYAVRFRAYLKTAEKPDAIDAKWKRERNVRNGLNMTPELRDALEDEKNARAKELKS